MAEIDILVFDPPRAANMTTDALMALAEAVVSTRPQTVLEFGPGWSTRQLLAVKAAAGVPERVVCYDTTLKWVPDLLDSAAVEFRVRELVDGWYAAPASELPECDMVVVDGPDGKHRVDCFARMVERGNCPRPGGCIFIHDAESHRLCYHCEQAFPDAFVVNAGEDARREYVVYRREV